MSRFYYCSAIEGKQFSLIAGPFATNEVALEELPNAKRAALDSYEPRFAFAAFGTCSFDRNVGTGWFNDGNQPQGIVWHKPA